MQFIEEKLINTEIEFLRNFLKCSNLYLFIHYFFCGQPAPLLKGRRVHHHA